MDNSILATLQNIEEQTARLNKVAFVFQPWIEFNNLGVDGFRIPAVQHETIPRLTLIPLVSISVNHIESRKNLSNNKYVPLPVAYTRSIYSSYIDLLQRYGRYGLVHIPSLDCDLRDAVRLSEAFEKMMSSFHIAGLLEDLPEYFGEESPVIEQLESRVKRIRTTAAIRLKSLNTHKEISDEDAERLYAAIPVLADSATKAHRAALSPSNGTLPQSIEEINERKKARFDEVDNFLRRQFPGYNSDSLLSRRSGNSDLAALTEVLRDLVSQRTSTSPEEVKKAVDAAERVAPGISEMLPSRDGVSDAEIGVSLDETNFDSGRETSSESLEGEDPSLESLKEIETVFDPDGCQGRTKSGGQCKIPPAGGKASYPNYCLGHQAQAVEHEQAAAVAA